MSVDKIHLKYDFVDGSKCNVIGDTRPCSFRQRKKLANLSTVL